MTKDKNYFFMLLAVLTAWKLDGIIMLFALLAMMLCYVPEAESRFKEKIRI